MTRDTKQNDGSAGDANYGVIGTRYSQYRNPEPKIAALIHSYLGDAKTVLNVGAGAGSYEPIDRDVTAVEPSATMRAQRPSHLSPAIEAIAEALPFDDKSFDASMATFTIHQWKDLSRGLAEMRRVTRGPVLLLSCVPEEVCAFWLHDYAPKVLETEARRYPTRAAIEAGLAQPVELVPVPIPLTCQDGFNEAYYGRPEMLLDPGARTSCSAWSFVAPETADAYVAHLAQDLASGAWDTTYGTLRTAPFYHGSLYVFVAR